MCFVGYSQSKEQLEDIQAKTNRTELLKLKVLFDSLYLEREKRIEDYLLSNPNVQRKVVDGFYVKEIYDVTSSGEVLYNETDNANSAITARANTLYDGGTLGLNVQGQGMHVGVWDGGQVRDDHVEFAPFKAINMNPSFESNNHATHVMGTIIANGTNPALRGLAFNATGDSYDWNNDSSEMSFAAASGLLVSNHSYGPSFSGANNWFLGAYDTSASQMDLLALNAPYYLIVKSAGNDRNATT
ncbi:MAG: S8 family serine peptidase, partial [Candidatus Paceibacterota bacterium]